MKNNHSNNIAAVSVGLRENRYGSEYTEICSRFFCSAAMLRDRDSLGLQIRFSGKKGTEIVAFSDTALSLKDYAWIFQPGADVTAASAKDLRYPDGTVMYSFSDSGPFPAESRTGVIQLTEELRGLGAILTVTVSRTEPSRCSVTLHSPVPLPLRVLVMVSCLFQGEAAESTSGKEGMGSLLPAKTVSEAITALFYAISSRSGETEEEEFAELIPEDQYPEDTPIEELSLSVRAFNCLKRAGIHTLKELRAMSEDDLRRVRNLGKKCFEEVLAKRRKCSPLPEEEEEKEQETTKEPGKSGRELLDELIGLDGVKRQVRRIAALAVMQQDMKEKGMEHTPVTLNMAFVGNPGTAKTTAARIMAKILYEAGFLKNPQVTEVGRADLVGQYAGQTAKCVQNVFQSAKGGLLFIDEAYSLLEEWHNGYGDEAINTIVQEMENKREDTIVVFAGYPGPMEDFFARNPGIRSRIPFILPFADYSVTEMMQIAVLEAKKRGFSVSPDAAEALEGLFAEGRKSEENGNGRFCRNLIENAILSYAERIWGEGAGTGTNNYILQKEDFADCRIRSGKSAGTIGFLAP